MSSIFIAGVGHSIPDTGFPEDLLKDRPQDIPYAPSQRATCLPAEYIQSTKNEDPFGTKDVLTTTPTNLGAAAARMAVERSSFDVADIELIIGSTSTPVETIPTESQRLGKALEAKIPAYDIYSGGTDFALHLETLSSWKEERTPNLTLSVSSHIPTSRLNYQTGSERFLFGDGSAAMLISKSSGAYRLQHAASIVSADRAAEFCIELYGHLHYGYQSLEEECFLPQLEKLYREAQSMIGGDVTFIESQLTPSAQERLRGVVGGENWLSTIHEHGNVLGASPLITLSKHYDALQSEQVVIFLSGIGLSAGIIVLHREG